MSTTIDQRVVEMRFDNKHFEQNVSTTMSTLDKLKQKLNLSGAAKGLEEINSAAKHVDMNALGSGVEAVRLKFSALEVFAVTALSRISNAALTYGKNIVKSLTLDPIKSGFEEYETKMGSIQTILANTEHQGTTLDDVTAALDELNTYADKTIYNFQQMTKNIGTFTAAGVDLDTSVRSIQGIANLAAVSGSTSQQASTAMYQLSQALAAGTVKLMDWNSVVNAGMGGKVFQNALIRTAAMLDGQASDVEAWQKKHVDAYGSFRESLTKEAWLTTEVLTTTLEQFTMAAEEGSEEWEAFKKSLMESGYSEKQAEEILKMANTATDAATKVKTFTQLMDTLKESAQSGWAQTWELIVGDFEEAKAFFTELSDLFGGIIGTSADRRNSFLGGALTSNWDKLLDRLNDAGIKASKFEESIRKVVGDDKLDKLVEDFGSLDKAVKGGAISSDDLKKALEAISGTKAGDKISNFVEGLEKIERTLNRGSIGDEVKNLQTALNELGYDLGDPGVDGIIGPITEKAIKAFQEANGLIVDGIAGPQTLAALKKAGAEVENLGEDVDGLVDSCDDLIDSITKTSGRELILDSLMNVIKAIQRPLAAVGEALRNTFSISTDQLYNALVSINKFTKKLVPKGILDVKTWTKLLDTVNDFGIDTSDFIDALTETLGAHGVNVDGLIEKYGSLGEAFEAGAITFDTIKEALLSFEGITESLINGGETADKVRRTFEGLFAILDLIGIVLAGPVKLAFKIVTDILGRLGLSLLDVTAKIGDAISNFRDNVDKVVGAITTFIVDNVAEWIKQFKETEFFKTVSQWFEDAAKAISDAVDKISDKISGFNGSALGAGLATVVGFITSIASSVADSELFRTVVNGICNGFDRLRQFFRGFKLPEFNIDNLKTWFQDIVKIGEKISDAGGTGLGGALKGFGGHLKDNVISWDWTVFKENTLQKFVEFWLKMGDKVKAAFEKGKEVAKAIKEFIFGTEEVNLPTILKVAKEFLGLIVLLQALKTVQALTSPLDGIADALDNLASSFKWDAMARAFKAMALAIAAFALAIVVITQIGDMKKAWSAAGMLIALMVVLGGVVVAIGLIASKVDGGLNTAGAVMSLLMLVGSIVLLVHALKQIDELDLKRPWKTFLILGGILLALTAGVKMISKAAGSSFRSVAAILTLLAALKLILEVIEDYDKFDWAGKMDAIYKMGNMMVILGIAINLASRGIKAGASASGLAMLLIAMVVSLKLLLGIIEEFAAMDDSELKRGGAAIAALLGVMTIMIAVANLTSKGVKLGKGERSVNNFTGFAIALLAVVGAIWLLGKMATANEEVFTKGLTAVIGIILALTTMLGIIGSTCSGFKMGSVIALLIVMGALMAGLTGVIKFLEDVPWQNSISSAGALALLLLAMCTALKTIKSPGVKNGDLAQWVGIMFILTGFLYLLAFALQQMNGLDAVGAIANAGALTILLGALVGATAVMSKVKIDGTAMKTWIGPMIGMIIAAAAMSVILRQMNGTEDAIKNATALAILIGALSLCTIPLAAAGLIAPAATSGLLALVALSVVLGVLTFALSKITGIETARENAITLALLAAVLSLCTIPLAAAGLIAPTAITGAFHLAVLATILGLLVKGLSAITGVDTARENAITLANLAIVLSLCTIPLAVAGLIAPGAIVGAGLLLALAVVLGLLIWGLSGIKDTETARTNVETIIMLLASMTTMILAIGSLGFDSIIAVSALNMLIALVTKVGILAAAIGLLTKDGDLIDKGLLVLKRIAGRLGEIISAFALGLTSDLPEIAENLSAFVEKAEPFVSLVRGIGDDVATGAGNLAKAILAFLGADLVAGIANLFGVSLTDLATDLEGFAEGITPFIEAMKSVDSDAAVGVESLVGAVSALTAASFWDSIGDKLLGGDTLSSFGESIASFATCIKDASIELKNITDEDVANIQRSATAGQALADLNSAIPRQGGWVQDVLGAKELGAFGESIVAFAKCIVEYSKIVTGNDIDVKAIESSAAAGKALAELNHAIPEQGGWADVILGAQDLAAFGESIVTFADYLVQYSNKVSEADIDTEAISNSATAAGALAELNGNLPSQNGLWQAIAGEKNLGEFGTQLVAFAEGIVAYANAASTIDQTKIDAITNSGTAVEELVAVVKKIPSSGGWGDAIFGSSDGQSFGTALSSLASGITSYCQTAATIGDPQIQAIKNSKTAIDELSTILTSAPDAETCAKAGSLLTAVRDMKTITTELGALSAVEINAAGITQFRVHIIRLANILQDVEVESLKDGYDNLHSVIKKAVKCANKLLELNEHTYGGIDTFKAAIKSLAGVDLKGAIDALSVDKKDLTTSLSAITTAMRDALTDGGWGIENAMTAVMDRVLGAVTGKAGEFEDAGEDLGSKLKKGLNSKKDTVKTAGEDLGDKAADGADDAKSDMKDAGKDLGDGLVQGIDAKKNAAYWAGHALGQAAVQGEKDGQKSASPSKETIKAGKWLGEGLIIGMERIGGAVYRAGKTMGSGTIDSISNSIRKISTLVENGIDSQPTIRPVLDLSDVRAGAGMISGMFGDGASIGVRANIGAISSMMNSRSQNGANADIVSAIDKLNRKMDNMGNTTYRIDGITYDDGSNIAEAVRTITRAAVRERRV